MSMLSKIDAKYCSTRVFEHIDQRFFYGWLVMKSLCNTQKYVCYPNTFKVKKFCKFNVRSKG